MIYSLFSGCHQQSISGVWGGNDHQQPKDLMETLRKFYGRKWCWPQHQNLGLDRRFDGEAKTCRRQVGDSPAVAHRIDRVEEFQPSEHFHLSQYCPSSTHSLLLRFPRSPITINTISAPLRLCHLQPDSPPVTLDLREPSRWAELGNGTDCSNAHSAGPLLSGFCFRRAIFIPSPPHPQSFLRELEGDRFRIWEGERGELGKPSSVGILGVFTHPFAGEDVQRSSRAQLLVLLVFVESTRVPYG